MSSELQKWPFDWDRLKKGDRIPAERLERVVGHKRSEHKDYSFALLSLAQEIEREMGSRGNPVTVRRQHDDLIILTDSQAALHNDNQFQLARRKMGRALVRQAAVDTNKLSDDEMRRHEQRYLANSRMYQAILRERRKQLPEGDGKRLLD